MKKFLLWCLGTLVAAVIAIAGSTLVFNYGKTGSILKPAVGVEEVANALDSIVNPELYTTKDVFELQNRLTVNTYTDSVFLSMSQSTLENVASVCLKRSHSVTKEDIVSEFVKNRHIYDNLPTTSELDAITMETPPTKELANADTAKEAPPTRVEGSSNYKDTVIDGKHAIIKQ